MKPHQAQAVWQHWLRKKNTAQIARIIGEPEYEVDKTLHKFLQRRHEVNTALQELANAER